MSYLDHDGLAYFKSKLDRTFIADIVFDDGDILLYGGDGTLLKTVVQEGTVTQKKSTTNKEYPILLCWDADAEEDQTMKTVWYGLDARINPKFGYLYARRYYTEHPSYERTSVPSVRAEWHHMFTDAVSAPMGEVYEYLDRVSDGGEHRMELRLYGNPLSQYVDTPNHNEATDAVSIGIGATKGDKLTFFGYCPSTPIYLENGSTMRKSTVRGDQYGKDIITRDWLNLNGSITGLVHTYMDETIDGYKTFLKTVTIDSGNDNAKAGLNVQGDVNIDSGDNTKPSNLYVQGNSHIHGNEDIDGNLNVDGTSTLDGNVHMKHNLDVDGNLNVDGTSDQHGNVHMYNNLDVDGNANTDGNQTIGGTLAVTGNETVGGTLTVAGKITGNGGAEISGGSGLKVNGNETVTGDLGVGGTINKVSGNTTQEYVTYVTSQPATREAISQNLLALGKGLAKDSQGKIYVDFSQIDNNTKAAILAGLDIQVPIKSNITLTVNPGANNDTDSFALEYETRKATPFTTISKAVEWASSKLALGTKNVYIDVYAGTYSESVGLPEVNCSSGHIIIQSHSGNKDVIVQPPYRANGLCGAGFYAGYGACKWTLKHMTVDIRLQACSDTGNTTSGISATADGAVIELFGCTVKALPTSNTITGESYGVRMIEAALGGKVFLYPDDKGSELIFDLPTTNTAGIAIYPINVTRQGVITWCKSDNSTNGHYYCQGSCTTFFDAWQSGSMQTRGSVGPDITFDIASGHTVTGKKYAVRAGSFAVLPTGGFPGSIDGTVEDSTYSWVS